MQSKVGNAICVPYLKRNLDRFTAAIQNPQFHYVSFQCNKSCLTLLEYIFPLPRNAFPREGTGVKTDFFFREKVSLSAVVGKKDGCLTDRSSCLPERSEGRQRREVRQSFRPETKERETFSRKRKRSDRTISLPGKRFLSRGMHFLS